jgi:hypothetical protein
MIFISLPYLAKHIMKQGNLNFPHLKLNCHEHKNYKKIDNEKIGLSPNSKYKTKGPRQEDKDQIQKHKLCKTKVHIFIAMK